MTGRPAVQQAGGGWRNRRGKKQQRDYEKREKMFLHCPKTKKNICTQHTFPNKKFHTPPPPKAPRFARQGKSVQRTEKKKSCPGGREESFMTARKNSAYSRLSDDIGTKRMTTLGKGGFSSTARERGGGPAEKNRQKRADSTCLTNAEGSTVVSR